MNKWFVFFVLLFTNATQAALPTTAPDYFVRAPIWNGGWKLGLTGLLLQSFTWNQDFAFSLPQVNQQAGGKIHDVRPNYHLGYQLFGNYLIPCSSNDVKVTYTSYSYTKGKRLHSSEGNFIVPFTDFDFIPPISATITLAGPGSATLLDDVLLFPGTPLSLSNSLIEATAKTDARLTAWDFDFGQYMDIDNFMRVRFFGGVRYSKIKHRFNVNYHYENLPVSLTHEEIAGGFLTGTNTPFIAGIVTTINLDHQSQYVQIFHQSSYFIGTGPRLGIEATFYSGGGFGLTGEFAGALLMGTNKNSASDQLLGVFDPTSIITTIVTTPALTATIDNLIIPPDQLRVNDQSPKKIRMVPNLEAKLEINYTNSLSQCRSFTFAIGYYVNYYFNAVDQLIGLPIDFNHNIYTLDANFSGPYISAEFLL